MNIVQVMKFGGVDLKYKTAAALLGKTLNNVQIDDEWENAQYYAIEDFYALPPEQKIPILIQISRVSGSKMFLVGFFQHEFLTAKNYSRDENVNLEMIMNPVVIPNSYGFYYEEEAYDFFMDLNERFNQQQTGNPPPQPPEEQKILLGRFDINSDNILYVFNSSIQPDASGNFIGEYVTTLTDTNTASTSPKSKEITTTINGEEYDLLLLFD